jgi:hypothetical protein
VGEADAVDAIGRLQLARRHDVRLRIRSDHGPVDRALDLVGLQRAKKKA